MLNHLTDPSDTPVPASTGSSIEVYSTPHCVQCTATYRKLDGLGLSDKVVIFDISQDPDARDYVLSLGHKQAPVVIAPDGRNWSGYNPDKLTELADALAATANA